MTHLGVLAPPDGEMVTETADGGEQGDHDDQDRDHRRDGRVRDPLVRGVCRGAIVGQIPYSRDIKCESSDDNIQGLFYVWSKSNCLMLLKYVCQCLLEASRGSPDVVHLKKYACQVFG